MIKAIKLKTSYLVNPIGVDFVPRLFWNVGGAKKQTAYRVVASNDGNILWDSGKIASDKTCGIACPIARTSRMRVDWNVTLWDENGEEGEPSNAFFEFGLLNKQDFVAKWITGNYKPNKKTRYPVDHFKKSFDVEVLSKARLYITACGLYEAKINGVRVGKNVLAPGITDYNKRIYYQTYDVTSLLRVGENTLEIALADGWYRGSCGAWGNTCQYGTETKVWAQLEVDDSCICTDESWLWSNDGAIIFADIQDGENVDARKEATYFGEAKVTTHTVLPCSSNCPDIREKECFTPNIQRNEQGYILDFGTNLAGYVRFSLKADAGQKITLRFGEMLESGKFTQKNIQEVSDKKTTPLQEVNYICKKGVNEYKTTFAYFGFRYVLVETDIPLSAENFVAVAIYSDMEETLKFRTSHKQLNDFVTCTVRSAKSNSVGLPTDCPTRERHGWTGDAQLFCKTASYMFNYMPFMLKYLGDLYDAQRKDGCLVSIVPKGGVSGFMKMLDGSAGWADAGVIIPYTLWKMYGDEEILERHYGNMKRYAKFLIKSCGKSSLFSLKTGLKSKDKKYIRNKGLSYGEWAEPADIHVTTPKDFITPHTEVMTAYVYYTLSLLAEIANTLKFEEDAEYFGNFAQSVKVSYGKLSQSGNYTLDTDRQARLVRPLAFGLLEGEQKAYAQDRLIKALDNYGWRLGTGFLSTPFILDVLAEKDIEHAYKLLLNEEMPGWLFMPKNGATTIWENWEGTFAKKVESLNHYSKGAVCRWLFDTACGIKVAGENSFIISPNVCKDIDEMYTEYQSIYGKVVSGWKRIDGKMVYVVEIPCNCTATININGEEKEVGAGEYVI